jgi:MoaA/NifB/PqqE/SkfB family radical SAM enzyme
MMKAKIKPRIEIEKRTRLEEVIPLGTPFVIFIDPADICNFQCKFCPTGNRTLIKTLRRSAGLMDFNLYRKIIDDICTFDKPLKCLRLYKDGEPLLNPKFPHMIRYAKEQGCALEIDTTTNGSLLNPRMNLELIHAGLDRINISVEGVSEDKYLKFSGYSINFQKFVDNIRHFYENRQNCKVCIKICGDILTDKEKDSFFDIFGDIADMIFIEHVAPCWPNFEMDGVKPNTKVGIYGQEICEVQVCPYIFYSLAVNSDGRASLCFLDWSRELLIGDVKKESLKDIWNGSVLLANRKAHLSMKRKDSPFCASCGQLSYGLPDNIDSFADVLLNRLGSNKQNNLKR